MTTEPTTTPATGTIAKLDGICKTYRPEDGAVLCGIDLTIRTGQTLAITGPSGSGKSTLLNILGLLDYPDANHGSICLFGRDPFTLAEDERAQHRNRDIGFVFQDHRLLPQCTVLENVLLPTLAGNPPLKPAEAEKRARDLLQQTCIGDLADRYPETLSGGQRQRAAIARALLFRPRLVLCDEPTGALDHNNAMRLGELLQSLSAHENTAIIIATHAQDLAALCQTRHHLIDGVLHPSGALTS